MFIIDNKWVIFEHTFGSDTLYMKICRLSVQYPKNGQRCLISGQHTHRRATAGSDILHLMQLSLVHIGGRSALDGVDAQVTVYLKRCESFAHCRCEAFKTEAAMLEWLSRQQGRTMPVVVLLDGSGRQMASEAFASWLGAKRDDGAQQIIFAVGPASGWSDAARSRAQLLLSLGPMTLAHALARLVIAEQLYRAFTILTGHPYHGGH